jgi:hypothetical protein
MIGTLSQHLWGPLRKRVESRCGAVALGLACLFPTLSSVGASVAHPWLRFHTPLIEPDVRISRIRLSDKTSCFRPRKVTGSFRHIHQSQLLKQVLIRKARHSQASNLVFLA